MTPEYTQNFNLYKPNRNDNEAVDLTLSTNFETIDSEIKQRKDEISNHLTGTTAHDSSKISYGASNVKQALDEALADSSEALTKANESLNDSGVALTNSETALTKSEAAETNSTEALTTANEVKGQFNEIVAEAGSNNPEVVQARGTEVNLNARLTKNESLLADKVTKGENGAITYAMLGQDAREQITGGNTAVVGVNAVLEENIVNKAVTPKKTSFFNVLGKNIFDKNDKDVIIGGYISKTNSLVTNSSYNETGYIPVNEADNIAISYKGGILKFYNDSKVFVSALDTTTTPNTNSAYFTVPAGVYYLRYTFHTSGWGTAQIEKGTVSTSYEAYNIKVGTDYLDTKNIVVSESNLDANLKLKINSSSTQSIQESLNTDIGLRRWKSSLAKMKAGVLDFVDVTILGDSISDGYGITPVTDYIDKNYIGRMRTALSQKYGDAGKGLITSYFPYNDNPKYWTLTGSWTRPAYGFAGGCMQSAANGDTAQLTFNGTGIKVIFWGGSWGGVGGRTCNIQIDGGTPISFDTYNATDKLISKDITGLTEGEHTLLITSTSGGHVFLAGAVETKGTKGIRFHHTGRSGALSSTYTNANIIGCVDFFAQDLTIINLGANDFLNNIDPSVYKTTMQTLITRALQYGDVLLVATGLSTNVQTYQQAQYVQVLKELAADNNVAFISINDRWSGDASYAKNTLGYIYDNIHPNSVGYMDIATALLKVIDEY